MNEWAAQGNCYTRGVDVSVFFPRLEDPNSFIDRAKAVCEGCPVRSECLEDAMTDTHGIEGVWGGLSHIERRKLQRKRRRPRQSP